MPVGCLQCKPCGTQAGTVAPVHYSSGTLYELGGFPAAVHIWACLTLLHRQGTYPKLANVPVQGTGFARLLIVSFQRLCLSPVPRWYQLPGSWGAWYCQNGVAPSPSSAAVVMAGTLVPIACLLRLLRRMSALGHR